MDDTNSESLQRMIDANRVSFVVQHPEYVDVSSKAVLLDFRDTSEWKAEQVRLGEQRLREEARAMARAEYEKTDAYRLEQEKAERKRVISRRAKFMAYILEEVPDAANICTDLDALMAVYEHGYYDGSMSHRCSWDR